MARTIKIANHEIARYSEWNSHHCTRCGMDSGYIRKALTRGITIPCDLNFRNLDGGYARSGIERYLVGADLNERARAALLTYFGITTLGVEVAA